MYTPRTYQNECIEAIFESLKQYRSVLAVLATGLGKTVIFSTLAKRWAMGRVLIVAHRRELISQAAEKLESVLGEPVGIEMGSRRSPEGLHRPRVVVASIQTLAKVTRMRRFKPQDFGLVVFDEAHHATAKGYLRVVHFLRNGLSDNDPKREVPGNPDIKIVGVTATPKRHDKVGLSAIFQTTAYTFGMRAAIDAGWLVPVRQAVVRVEGLDFSSLQKHKGDFTDAELESILTQERPLHDVAAAVSEYAGTRPTIVFCAGVKHAKLLATVLSRYPGRTAIALDGETDTQEREDRIADFKAGKIQFLCNCGLFLEGFDAPKTALVVMARPTLSLALYEQMIGRGTRTLEGVVDSAPDDPKARRAAIAMSPKPDCLVLDFAGNAGRHRIVNALDILGGKRPPDVVAYAKKALEDGEYDAAAVDAALDRAQAELELEVEEAKRRKHVRADRVHAVLEDVSPFDGSTAATTTIAKPKVAKKPPTEPQIRLLCLLGISQEAARRFSRKQAGKVIDKLKKERGWS